MDLQISKGNVSARVSGSELYRIEIKIQPLAASLWKFIQAECAGKIDSLIELLQGKLSSAVMQIVARRERGLFPAPKEIDLDCSRPDRADLYKHVAASLYGVGAKLDQNPSLLFLLRGVDPSDLISKASAAEAVRQTTATAGGAPAMSEAEVADVFGIELEPRAASSAPGFDVPAPPSATPAPMSAPAPRRSAQREEKLPRRLSATARARIAAAAKARWAKFKNQPQDRIRTLPPGKRRSTKTSRPGGRAPQRPAKATRARITARKSF